MYAAACRDRAATARKSLKSRGVRSTSKYRGVTHHCRTGRWEAHIWENGKQVGGGAARMVLHHRVMESMRMGVPQCSLCRCILIISDSSMTVCNRPHMTVVHLACMHWSLSATQPATQPVSHPASQPATQHLSPTPSVHPPFQVYLGGFDGEEQAALAYDIAAIKCRGTGAITNFEVSNYQHELQHLGEVGAGRYGACLHLLA